MTEYDRALQAADYIRACLSQTKTTIPSLAVVLGSGLHPLAGELTEAIAIPYGDIPHFPTSTVAFHEGKLLVGRLQGVSVFLLSGRFHYYEGYDLRQTTFYVKVLRLLGVRVLLLTNAAGGVNESFAAGDLMLVTDHIKLALDSPVRGENDERLTPRFFDMSRAYSPRLQQHVIACAAQLGIPLRQGVYVYMGGPQYETPAEVRMIRLLGGDAVGMSTVPEAITAVACGMEVAALSCITNAAAGVLPETTLSHEEVAETAKKASERFCQLMGTVIKTLKIEQINQK
ncbi:MAG: purine-nucleoside phosphorylase [Clostridia bacterium]|nr:purine-nucleoside phosphorylase [Clostridia bacterium]